MKKLVALLLSLCLAFGMLAVASAETKTGAAQGFGSEVKVTVTVDDGKITAIDVDDSGESYPSAGFDRAETVEKLIDACREYYEKTGRRISFEYAMIDGVNDSPEQARLLAKHASSVAAHVNLIPLNHVEERQFQPSTAENMKRFIGILEENGVNVTVRRKLGGDVDASCGQLRRKMQRQKGDEQPT
jgi:hypothetical protein